MVLTSKHHDGYCLWDTKTTEFNSMKLGPHRDLLKEFVEAVRGEGLKAGVYYSSTVGAIHPDICGIGPMYGRMKKRENGL